ncbi:cation transporting ATPase, putative [Plasmodium gaboni]|uniref:Cation transporting ATPase, putative n=1 Tax=Plasmodium gaboni TaxID=647221 RepID=A0ABY1UKW2_9APIC|nr:cation transporting ATPase, putative [Plasmodium gaboni]
MSSKYNILIYKKKKKHLRLDVLLFFFYLIFLNLILQNKKFEAQQKDYEYIENLKTKNVKDEGFVHVKKFDSSSSSYKFEDIGNEDVLEEDNNNNNNNNIKSINNVEARNDNMHVVNNMNKYDKSLKENEKIVGGNETNENKNKTFESEDLKNEKSFKPIIIGKYNLIYIFYSIEFICLLLFICLHVLLFLLSQWNIKMNLLISYKSLYSKDKKKYLYNLKNLCTHVYIEPCIIKSEEGNSSSIYDRNRYNMDFNFYKPKAQLIELKKVDNDIYFFYKQKKYIFNYNTFVFESLKHFDNFNVGFYLNWKGLIDYNKGSGVNKMDIYNNKMMKNINESVTCNNIESVIKKLDILYTSHSDNSKKVYMNEKVDEVNDNNNNNNNNDDLINKEKNVNNIYDMKNMDDTNKSNMNIKYRGKTNKGNNNHIDKSKGDNMNNMNNVCERDDGDNKKKIYNIQNNIHNNIKKNDNLNDSNYFYYKKSSFEIPYDIFVHNNIEKYGENIYDIPCPCFKELLYESMLSPFFIFQFFSIVLWMLDSYWYFGIFSIFILIILESQLINKRIRDFNMINGMKVDPQDVYVYRNLRWNIMKSNMLLPGDIYILTNDMNMTDNNICTCETLLIDGTCITDESILTGESVPLIKACIDKSIIVSDNKMIKNEKNEKNEKYEKNEKNEIIEKYVKNEKNDHMNHINNINSYNSTCNLQRDGENLHDTYYQNNPNEFIKNDEYYFDDWNVSNSLFCNRLDIKNKHKKHIVYAGTNILMTKNENNKFNGKNLPVNGCIGIVLRSGFSTYQGKLVRTIINTSEKVNSSSFDSIIFLIILLLFSICSSAYVVYSVLKSNEERNLYKLLLSVSHIITAVIPPEFPITLSLAVTISIVYLYNMKIYCTEPFRLPFSGKTNICAFDKTGTLTEDNMIVLGLFGLDNNYKQINQIKESIINKQKIPFFSLSVIAGCHSICSVNNKLLGDPLEKNSFMKLKCVMKSLNHTYVYTNNKKNDDTTIDDNKNNDMLNLKNEKNKDKKKIKIKNESVENFQIVKRFFFSSELQRMTCILLHEGSQNDWYGDEYETDTCHSDETNENIKSDVLYNNMNDISKSTCYKDYDEILRKLKRKNNNENETQSEDDMDQNDYSNYNPSEKQMMMKKKKNNNNKKNKIKNILFVKKKKENNDKCVKQYLVVSKGSPELMKRFLKKIPEHYDEVLNSLSIKGYRVLCLAVNILDDNMFNENITREDVEKDLYFCGFLTFICPIKVSTPNYILNIKNAGIKNIMITGDNALTACQVSQDVNIVPHVASKHILILKLKELSYDMLNEKETNTLSVINKMMTNNDDACDDMSSTNNTINTVKDFSDDNKIFNKDDIKDSIEFLTCLKSKETNIFLKNHVENLIKIIEMNCNKCSNILYFINRENKKILPFIDNIDYIKSCGALFSLCITGDIIDYFLQVYKNNLNIFNELIRGVYIFCRMSPKNKEIIIKTLNKIGYITIMCGDGTNDMAALKAAHVGVSLLSIKVSYKNKDGKNKKMLYDERKNSLNNNNMMMMNMYGDGRSRSLYDNLRASYAEARNIINNNNNNNNSGVNCGVGLKFRRSYEQMKLYNEKKKELEQMLQSLDDSLPLIKLGEASIASPFTYKGNDIKCIKEIISCGRCALSKVIMMYKLMIINSLITAFSVSILTLDGVKLSDAQTTVISLLYTSLIVLISKTSPLKSITNYKPPNSLFNFSVIISLLLQIIIHFSILIYGWKLACTYREINYIPDIKGEFKPNIVNTCIYYLIYCINLSIFSCNYEGLPFMIPIHKNKEIVYIFLVNFFFLLLLIMDLFPYLNYFFSLVSFPNIHFKCFFFFLMLLDIFLPYLVTNLLKSFRFYIFNKYQISI